MLHCSDQLDAYYDGELSAARRRQVEAHLEECPTCRAELEQRRRLSALLVETPLPDVFSAPQLFGAQVALRVSRQRAERSRYQGAAWHIVPLLLLSGLIVLQGLFAVLGSLTGIVRMAERLGLDVEVLWPWWQAAALQVGQVLPLSSASLVAVVSGAVLVVLYLATIAVFVPYAGWVRTLWHSAQDSLAGKEV
jgi:anti-sigma factor RsiW